jgi:hypothetical protein
VSMEVRAIVEASIEQPSLAYERCDFCSDKQEDRFIELRSVAGGIERLRLCGKCGNRLFWILPRLIAMLSES